MVKDPKNRGLEYSFNPIKIAFHEWQAIWEDVKQPNPLVVRLSYIFRALGWSPDGSRKTVKQLRAEQRHSRFNLE
ncbi:MAG: hypothetical protein ACE5IR_13550 [bacterium]